MRQVKKIKKQFDVAFLENLLLEETSCVCLKTCKHHLALHPYHLNDLVNSVKDVLNRHLSKYMPELEGILCGYKNIKLLNELGTISDDSCYIHVDIEADFFIFKPIIGQMLKGVVKKMTKDHVGCLVHNLFNVSLPLSRQKEFIEYLGVDTEVQFRIKTTNFDGRLPYIRGEIIEILTEGIIKPKKIIFDDSIDAEEKVITEPSKNKKKRKRKMEELDETDELPKKKRKSKVE